MISYKVDGKLTCLSCFVTQGQLRPFRLLGKARRMILAYHARFSHQQDKPISSHLSKALPDRRSAFIYEFFDCH